MKKLLFQCLVLLLLGSSQNICKASPPPSALNISPSGSTVSLCIEPCVGFYNGKTNEYVFDQGYKLSELDWNLEQLYVSGISAHCFLFNRLFLSGSFVQGINENIGTVNDSDWANYDGKKTNFSHHDNCLEKAMFTNLKIGYLMFLNNGIDVKAYLGYSYIDLKMQAEDGYLEYPPGSSPEQLYGIVMQYEQKYSIPYVGIGCGYSWMDKLSGSLFFNVTHIATCSTKDSHVLRSVDFYDNIKDIFWMESGAALDWKVSERIIIRATASYAMSHLKKGSDYYIATDTGVKSLTVNDASGTKLVLSKFEFSTNVIVF